ncbi:hypothetical protein E2C01_047778 [Portunus trituberculatus]|uniref:Uncharacterized protein n=1 Tax=Portunus trituberculatus TaxID=210409 RepID=A0A5B7G8S6_PORTR|nr:hypothetical protein [Portunus trituberculatus]
MTQRLISGLAAWICCTMERQASVLRAHHYCTLMAADHRQNFIPIMTRFHIHSTYYLQQVTEQESREGHSDGG